MQAPTRAKLTRTVGARSFRAQCRVNTEGLKVAQTASRKTAAQNRPGPEPARSVPCRPLGNAPERSPYYNGWGYRLEDGPEFVPHERAANSVWESVRGQLSGRATVPVN